MTIHPMYLEKNIDDVVKSLEEASRLIFKWFSENQLQENVICCQ